MEGVVTTEYRVNKGELPDVQMITKKMAIVAWQPGPNRVLMVPAEVRMRVKITLKLDDCVLQYVTELWSVWD